MIRPVAFLAMVMAIGAPGACAQTALETANLLNLTDRLQEAIDARDWPRAAGLSATLKQALKESRNRSLATDTEDRINTILGWIPADTETVIVAREAFRLDFNSQRGQASPGALRLTQGYTLIPISARTLDELNARLEGQTLRSAVFAARRFQNREPGPGNVLPSGPIAYQGCGIYALAKPLTGLQLRSAEGSMMGYPVWSARNPLAGYPPGSAPHEETLLVSQPRPDVLVACNDRSFLSEVVARIDGAPRIRAFPTDSPLLHLVDRSAAVWGIRRFLPERVSIDPSHPATGGLLGVNDAEANAVIVEAAMPKNTIRAQWISRSRVNPWQALASANEVHGAAKVQQNRDGIWQLTVEQESDASAYVVFVLMGMLGFMALV